MIRAFVAISLPEAVRFDLMLVQQGLPVPRLVAPENLHLTLAFLGELPEPQVADVDLALGRVRAPRFELTPAGLGIFGGDRARAVYAGLRENAALRHLQGKVETAVRGAGIALPARRFLPHVTLARLSQRHPDPQRLERAVAGRAGYAGPGFEVERFVLFRSHLVGQSPIYEELASYDLVAEIRTAADPECGPHRRV